MTSGIRGDRPLGGDEEDRLGFSPLAEQIAKALIDRASADGVVVGIEGEWGSGKSSLMALVTRALNAYPDAQRPEIVQFSPWLVGNRDALLGSLFNEITKSISRIRYSAGDATPQTKAKIKDAVKWIHNYGSKLGYVAPLVSIAGLTIPGAGLVVSVFDSIYSIFKSDIKELPLLDSKDKLNKALSGLPKRIIVIIDDVDRLEPYEVAEILRLVRSVADFQNVVYVLCYDPKIIGDAVNSAMGICDGQTFLEKIVQVSVAMPLPEPFVLRRMFKDGLEQFSGDLDERIGSRLADVIDQEGGRRLLTPRDVIRILDSLRFVWPPLQGRVDLPDLVWLHLIKIGNFGLYKWIENYVASVSAVSGGYANVGDDFRKESFEKLQNILSLDNFSFEIVRYQLAEMLPGIGHGLFREGREPIYAPVTDDDRLSAIAGRRLASPDHYRLFFALETPMGVPSERDFQVLWEAVDKSSEEFGELLLRWVELRSGEILSKADLILERLRVAVPTVLDAKRSRSILTAFADVLDQAVAREDERTWGGPPVWRQARHLLPILRSRLADVGGVATVDAFRGGKAIGWLSKMFRDEIFDHGRFGDRGRPEQFWLMPDEELDVVTDIMQNRYKAMTMDEVLATPEPLSLLFAWIQSGSADDVRKLIDDTIQSDEGLIAVLNHMANTIRTSSDIGKYGSQTRSLIIKRDALEQFLDYDVARRRVSELAEGASSLKDNAKMLIDRFKSGDEY